MKRNTVIFTKLLPVSVRVKLGLFAIIVVGLIAISSGTGFRTVNVAGFDIPPPGRGLDTVT